MAPTWAVVQHADWEGPGLFGPALEARGHGFRVYRTDRGDALPAADLVAGLIVMGGPQGVYEAAQYPYLAREQALLSELVRRDRPVLGVCLGSQLLAAALGAAVARGPVAEIGMGEVALTPEGEQDAVLGAGPIRLPVVHWHQDTFPLPAGAVRLASSDLYPQQAFRVGRRAYGLQFHCEVDESLAAAWRPFLPSSVRLDPAHVRRVSAVGERLIARFLDLAED